MQRFAILLPGLFLAVSMTYGQTPQATLLGRWYEDTLVGSSAYDNTYNEVWGFAVEGHEYAIIGSTAGTHFIEVTDPTQPTEVFFFAGKAQGKSIVHRDYETYNGFIYAVCDEGQSSLQIIDIRQMPDTAFVVYDSNNLVNRSHNIEIDTSQGMLYTFATSGGSGGFSAMRVYDLADPANPALIGAYNTFGDITAGHVHDGYVRNGLAFLNCGYDGLAIVDFTDPANPVAMGTLPDYPAKGYNHSGWGDESGDYYYLADENHATPMKVLDVSDPTEIKVLGTFDAQVPNPNSIPHNQLVRGEYLYVSYYYEGLVVFDISDPSAPVPAYAFDTSNEPNGKSYKGAWGVYPYLPSGNILVSDMQEGLFVFEKVDETITSTTPSGFEAPEVAIYPNPASTFLTISYDGNDLESIHLFDLQGRHCGQWTGSQRTLHLPDHLSGGMYFLQLNGAGGQVTERIQIRGGR